ncbi:MAG: hypothetical protein GY931_20185 [Maribacter sp.]|nr:hypothetical protein [Maribacter sp.]
MKFWKLEKPDYDSDYDSEYINGGLDHPFGLPGINCDSCGETWSGSRILSIECPEILRNDCCIKDGWPITFEKFSELEKRVSTMVVTNFDLKPGDRFQPSYLDVASKPEADFLWSSIGSVLVSERIKNFFEQYSRTDIDFAKVIKRHIGKNKAHLPAPIPESGEPEDIMEKVEFVENLNEVNDCYEMIIKHESKHPLFTKVKSICDKCKRENIDNESRLLLMTDELWNEHTIFLLSTTLYIIITDDLKIKLEEIQPTNIRITDITKKS